MTDLPFYLDHRQYDAFLEAVGISEADYLAAINGLIAVFPVDEARQYALEIAGAPGGLGAPFNLHAPPFEFLQRHPVKILLSGIVTEWRLLCELVRLGLDIRDTAGIPRSQRLRNRLSNLDEYRGALFEIELLAELGRAGLQPEIHDSPDFRFALGDQTVLLEVRHRGVSFARAIVSQLTREFAFVEFGELSINLRPKLGSRGESVAAVASEIATRCRQLIEQPDSDPRSLDEQEFSILYDPGGGPRSVSYSFGKTGSYAGDLAGIVLATVREKETQTLANAGHGDKRLVALDLRSLFPAEIPAAKEVAIAPGWLKVFGQKIPEWQGAVMNAAHDALEESGRLDAILLWLRTPHRAWPWELPEYFRHAYRGLLVTRSGFYDASSPSELVHALRSELRTA